MLAWILIAALLIAIVLYILVFSGRPPRQRRRGEPNALTHDSGGDGGAVLWSASDSGSSADRDAFSGGGGDFGGGGASGGWDSGGGDSGGDSGGDGGGGDGGGGGD